MLELLTEYLTKTHSVTIPGVGSLALERQPATWNVVDQQLLGPAFRVHAEAGEGALPQQLSWLAGAVQLSEEEAADRLGAFGKDLLHQLRHAPFLWPGIGLLQWQDGRLQVQPATPVQLPPLAAGRVIREDARHTIRVGEQEVASSFSDEPVPVPAERRNDLEWLAWLIAFLAALFVFYCLYSEAFSPLGSGLKTTVFNNLP